MHLFSSFPPALDRLAGKAFPPSSKLLAISTSPRSFQNRSALAWAPQSSVSSPPPQRASFRRPLNHISSENVPHSLLSQNHVSSIPLPGRRLQHPQPQTNPHHGRIPRPTRSQRQASPSVNFLFRNSTTPFRFFFSNVPSRHSSFASSFTD